MMKCSFAIHKLCKQLKIEHSAPINSPIRFYYVLEDVMLPDKAVNIKGEFISCCRDCYYIHFAGYSREDLKEKFNLEEITEQEYKLMKML